MFILGIKTHIFNNSQQQNDLLNFTMFMNFVKILILNACKKYCDYVQYFLVEKQTKYSFKHFLSANMGKYSMTAPETRWYIVKSVVCYINVIIISKI